MPVHRPGNRRGLRGEGVGERSHRRGDRAWLGEGVGEGEGIGEGARSAGQSQPTVAHRQARVEAARSNRGARRPGSQARQCSVEAEV